MKLYYSNAFDNPIYVSDKSSEVRYVGTLQLLTILERELGLYKTYSSNEERLKLYTGCLKKNTLNSFYSESLKADPYRVGKEILNLRDELVWMGWNSSLPNQPKRLSDIASVDQQFQFLQGFEGNADRWVRVFHELNTHNDFTFDFELIIQDHDSYIYPLLNAIFQKLNAIYERNKLEGNDSTSNLSLLKKMLTESFAPATYKNTKNEFNSLMDDQSLLLLKFANKQLLLDSIASISKVDEHILLANNAADLDFSIVGFGKNAVGSQQQNSNPQLVQLFKLIIPCFSEFNIHTFISFLQLKDSPIPYELRNELLKTIIDIPGLGNEKWNTCINDFMNGTLSEDEDLTTKKRNEIVNLFLSFEPVSEEVAVQKAKKIVDYLIKWSSKALFSKQNQLLKEQFHYLYELFVKLKNLIEDEISLSAIENAFNIVYESSNFTNYEKQEDSIFCLNNLGNIVSGCDKSVILTDFYGATNVKDNTKFLLTEEQVFLKENNCFYNTYDLLNTSNLLRGLNKVNKQLILCYYEDDKLEKHPFHVRMETLSTNLDKSIVLTIDNPVDLIKINDWKSSQLPLTSAEEIRLPEKSKYLKVEKVHLLGKRDVESASSIEKFIQYPFEWVLEYKLKMRAYQGIQLGRESQLKGNIAHKVIENIFSKFIHKPIHPSIISREEMEKEFNQVVKQEGILFLQAEKRFELGEFKSKFMKSLDSLLTLLIENELSIDSCEYAFGYEDPFYLEEIDSNLNGYIDLVLKNKEGVLVVFDLKWTFSDKKFKQKIENNEEIQLALYTVALKDRANCITGYYLLNQNKLITTANLIGSNVVQIPSAFSTEDVLAKIEKSVKFRWEELKSGKLEIGDGMPVDSLDYQHQADLIQLPTEKKDKKENPYSGFELFKGQLN